MGAVVETGGAVSSADIEDYYLLKAVHTVQGLSISAIETATMMEHGTLLT